MSNLYLRIEPGDDLVVALADLPAGQTVELRSVGQTLELVDSVPAKHKFTVRSLKIGDPMTMYGAVVGVATKPIPAGGLIHTENVRHAADDFAWRDSNLAWTPPSVDSWKQRHFEGYRRACGRVGTANHWIVIPLVFCENRNLDMMRAALRRTLGYERSDTYVRHAENLLSAYRNGSSDDALREMALTSVEDAQQTRVFKNIDGVQFLTHDGGCGGTHQDSEALCQLLAGYVTHPNVAGATVLSLGCQHAQKTRLEKAILDRQPNFDKPLLMFEQQEARSETALLERALNETFLGIARANEIERTEAPLSELTLGVECGGSDGFSGLSANPTIGRVSDLIVALGGRAVLAEFPELCGAEQNLVDRCADRATAEKFDRLMRAYEKAAAHVGSGFDQNPSPGNIREGLITDAIKSLGAAKKGGTSPVVDVLDYHEPVRRSGLNLLCTPGNDVESTTGLVGAGANLVLFSTGLGTPTGNPIAPVLKLSSHTALAERMEDLIDFDTGPIVDGKTTIESLAEQLLDRVIETASGRYVPKAVRLGQDDFIPWKRGISL